MTAGDYIALVAIGISILGMASGIMFRLGRNTSQLKELTRRVGRLEDKIETRVKRDQRRAQNHPPW